VVDVLASLRQWRFPAALRIADPGPPAAALDMAGLEALLRALSDEPLSPPPPPPPPPPPQPTPAAAPPVTPRAFALRLANATWKVAQQAERLGDSAAGRALRDKLSVLTQLLHSEGIETLDYQGRDFDFGEIWDQVVGSDTPKSRPYIASMKAPRVLYRGEVIQAGTPVVDERASAPPAGENP
jgi:hypothetical protein